jgi:hypothetical protein
MTGSWPKEDIDHIDGNKLNNSWSNLRSALHQQNQCNIKRRSDNTSGFKGVSFHAGAGKWMAMVMKDSKSHYLGLYETPEAAHAAYCKAAADLHGAFFRSA